MADDVHLPPTGRRLAIVLSHPIQYYSPWFRWLRAHTALEFRVFYLWNFGVQARRDRCFGVTFAWDVDLLSGYESEFVPNVARQPSAYRFWGLRNPELPARLAGWQPNAILLFGYAYASHLRTILWARQHGVPLVFRGDSHFLGRPTPAWHRAWLLRLLYRQFAAITYVGQANRAYFEKLGVPSTKLFFAPHTVNHEHFDASRPEYRAAAVGLRQSLGLSPETRVVLYAGKYQAEKQPLALLESFLALRPPGAALVFVGDGEQRELLKERARPAPPGTVHFLPFANQSEMPVRYLLADIFVLPSRGLYETWGLAVNEAMHMGVPCLVSDRVGCQQDLVTDGQTGWVFRADDPAHLQAKLAEALAADLAPFKPHVAERIAGYRYETTASGLLAALHSL